MAGLRHPNIVMFLGACSEPPCMVTEYCARGSLLDILMRARQSPVRALAPPCLPPVLHLQQCRRAISCSSSWQILLPALCCAVIWLAAGMLIEHRAVAI